MDSTRTLKEGKEVDRVKSYGEKVMRGLGVGRGFERMC